MHLAWAKNATEIWIVNAGDLRPLVSRSSIRTIDRVSLQGHRNCPSLTPSKWPMTCHRLPPQRALIRGWRPGQHEILDTVAAGTAEAMATYRKLIVRRKYELLNKTPFMLSTVNYDETENVLNEWTALEAKAQAQALYDTLDTATRNAFFEIVLHPVMAGGVVQRVYINAARNSAYATQKRMSTNKLADDVKATYAQDAVIQKRYHGFLN
jgi:hypothetical protein